MRCARSANGRKQRTPAFGERMDSAILDVWRQALVEGAKRVTVEGRTYPVRRTAKKRLAQIDLEAGGSAVRGLEQLARKEAKVMQFLSGGRYIAAVADGKITHYQRAR